MDAEVENVDGSNPPSSIDNGPLPKTYARQPNRTSGLNTKLEILQDFGEITEDDLNEETGEGALQGKTKGKNGVCVKEWISDAPAQDVDVSAKEVPSVTSSPVKRGRGRPKKVQPVLDPLAPVATTPQGPHSCQLCGASFATVFGRKIHENACRRNKIKAEELAQEEEVPPVIEVIQVEEVQVEEVTEIEEVNPLETCDEVVVKRRRGRPPRNVVIKIVDKAQSPQKTAEKSTRKGNHQLKCHLCSRVFNTLAGKKIHESACRRHKKEAEEPTENRNPASGTTAEVSVVKKKRGRPPKNAVVPRIQEPQYRCDLCGRPFNTLPGLRRHEATCRRGGEMLDPGGYQPNVPIYNKQLQLKLNPNQPEEGDLSDEQIRLVSLDVKDPYIFEEGRCHCCGEDIETAHMGGEFECGDCKKLFRLKSSLERHRRVVHNEGETFQCPECDARCPDKGTLARHMYTHTGLKPVSCPVCKTEFSRKYHLIRHNYQTGCDGSKKPTFPCQVCGRIFNRKDNLREHLRAHAGQTKRKKKYTCEECNKEFLGTALLNIHKRTHNPNLLEGDKPYGCDFCPKRFPSNGAMKKHRRKHTGERPYECTFCFARFAAKETLNRHLRTHTGIKPHTCQFCGKGFIQASQLRAHVFHHSGEGGFSCEVCGKAFNRRQRLLLHIKYVHEGAEPYKCDHCVRTFLRKEDLARHQLLHSGIKEHKCPICEKCFAMKSSLKIHLLTHTKEPPRSCDECGRAFIRQDCLLRHMRTKHRDMLEEIMAEAEKKKLQQQLLAAANQAALELPSEEPHVLNETTLAESVRELLTLLVDETTLKAFGWPDAAVDKLLEAVIRRCGHQPAGFPDMPYADRLRENAKLLFTVVIDDSAVKTLLNNQTVDEVILHVLRLAKS